MNLLLGLDQAGLGPRRPLGGPALAQRRLPGPRGVLRSPEQAHDPVLPIARWPPAGSQRAATRMTRIYVTPGVGETEEGSPGGRPRAPGRVSDEGKPFLRRKRA